MREYIETVINGLKTTWLSMLGKVEESARQAKAAADEAMGEATNAAALRDNPIFTGAFSQNRLPDSVIGICSHAEGDFGVASGSYSHVEGTHSRAEGNASHAEGFDSNAVGDFSHAENVSTARGYSAHSEGYLTNAYGDASHVQGRLNIEDTSSKYAHIVGNGEDTGSGTFARSNAHTLDWNGVPWYQGRPQFGGTAQDDGAQTVMANGDTEITLKSSGGKEFKITVSDEGVLSATEATSA